MRRLLPTLLWLTLSLATLAASASQPALPDSWVALIRAERFEDAYTLGTQELMRLEATKSFDARARCDVFDRMARVELFDYADPDLTRQEHILDDARTCRAALPKGATRDIRIAWLTLRLTSLKASHGKLAEVKTQAQDAESAFLRNAALLPEVDRAAGYHALGSLATSRGDYATAAKRYIEGVAEAGHRDALARATRARVQAPLGAMLERTGRYVEAVEADRLALRWVSESFGEHSLLQASTFGTLAQTEFFTGRYADAIDDAERGIDNARTHAVHGRRALAFLLTTLGNSLRVTGELPRARDALAEALALERATPNSRVGTLAVRLNQLGYVEELLNGCTVAMPHYREALALGEKQFGADNVRIGVALTNIGGCELKFAHYDAARGFFERELAIAQRGYGTDHPTVAKSWLNLAEVALAQHDYASAQKQLHDAITLLPANSDALATTGIGAHRALAQALRGLGRDEEAFAEAAVAETARQHLLRKVGANLSETNALAFKDELVGAMDIVLALAARDPQPKRVATAWQLEIGARQLVTKLVAARLKASRSSAEGASKQAWLTWETASNAYGDALLAHESGKVDAASLRLRSEALDRAERALGRQFGESAERAVAAPPDLSTLQKALPDGSALIAYAIGDAEPSGEAHMHASPHIYAFSVVGGGEQQLLDLGPAASIDAVIRKWIAMLRDPRSDEGDVATSGKSVRRLIWDRIVPPGHLRRVFIVPEGDLHRVAWLALPLDKGTGAERGMVTQLLGNELDLAVLRPESLNAERLLLVGAPPTDANDAVGEDAACPQPAGKLIGAARELAGLQALWHALDVHAPVRVLDGLHATKDAVRTEAERSRTLHFATHAFAGDSPCLAHLLVTRGVRLTSSNIKAGPRKPEDDRALSGLVLAPASDFSKDHDNGVLTANEIAALKLDGVDQVTLAACDTGLGPVLPDEGVFGLARAFRVAGAHNVVMSLWQIDDAATADLMQRFYRARFSAGTDVAAALAMAARETLIARRAAGLSTHPYYWAGFISAGDGH